MATSTISFAEPLSMEAAAAAVTRTALSAETALSLATAAFDRAEILSFASYGTRSSTVLSGTYGNGDSATLTGSNLLLTTKFADATGASDGAGIQRLDYRFAGGQTSVVLTGDWGRSFVDWPFIGPVDRAVVTSGSERVTLSGIRPPDLGPTVIQYIGSWGFSGPVVGEDGLSAISFEKGGAILTYRGSLMGDTDSVNGLLVSSITGTVREFTLAMNGAGMTVTGLSVAYDQLEGAGAQDLLALALGGNDVVNGTAAGQLLQGRDGNDTVQGLGGDDWLDGGTGHDRLDGGVGNDTLAGGAGVDTLVGSLGDDCYQMDDADVILESPGGGSDAVLTALASFSLAGLGDVENLAFTGTGGFAGTGNAGHNRLVGGAGADTLAGGAGHDTLVGNQGRDSLFGDAGSDLLRGGGDGVSLSGGEGNDVLAAGAGDDVLEGGRGADALLGGGGNDVIAGGAGRDTLAGGAGDDTLTGGGDVDRFVLNSLSGIDEITDFVSGIDRIAINRSVFTAVTGAVSATPTTLAGLGGAFAYDSGSGELSCDADGAGGQDAVVIARFTPGLALADDFLIIG